MEKTNSKPETVNITLNVPLPKNFYNEMQKFSAFIHVPLETILVDELYSILACFFSGGHTEKWVDWLINDQSGVDWINSKKIEKDLETTREDLFQTARR